MNGMCCFLRCLLPVRGIPLRPRLALLLRGQLGPVLVADVPEPGAARDVLAPLDAAAHVQAAPSGAGGTSEPCRGLVCLGALHQDALLLPNRYAARMLPAKPSIAGAGARILATGVGTQLHAAGAHGGTACGRAGKHLFRTGCDSGCELLDQTVQQAVDGFRHSFVREMGLNYGRWGSLSSPFDNELLQPRS